MSADAISRRAFVRAAAALSASAALAACSNQDLYHTAADVAKNTDAFDELAPEGAPRIVRIPLAPPAGQPGLAGLRIGFVADVHRGRFVSRATLDAIATTVDAQNLDLLLLGGDLCNRYEQKPALVREALEAFGTVRVRLGRYAVHGNHDAPDVLGHRTDAYRHSSRVGVERLVNEGVRIEHRGSALWLCGLDDHTAGTPDPKQTFQNKGDDPALLLCHNPDAVHERLTQAPPTWLVLSGHLHAGQVRLPGIGPLLPNTRYPDIFDWGWAESRGRRVYVTGGVGATGIPLRLGCPPEIVVFEIHP